MSGPEEWLSTTEPGLPASFTFPLLLGTVCDDESLIRDASAP